MTYQKPRILRRIWFISILLLLVLVITMVIGISVGSTGSNIKETFFSLLGLKKAEPMLETIIWRIRLPRVFLATLVGAALSLGGLVFQALLRNPLAEPYILGISSGSGIGAIIGILVGLSPFPGISLAAFSGSMATLLLLLFMTTGKTLIRKNILLLSGVMVNAFCAAFIMFLISITQDDRLHNIIFWLMGDLSMADLPQVWLLTAVVVPCAVLIFCLSNTMNLFLMGKELAQSMGVNIRVITATLLVATSIMVSATVAACGPIGFVGLVIPHLLRLVVGPDHRVLVPACLLGGSAYVVLCDILARTLPQQGEMPAGVITAMIGAPLFIILLKKSKS